MTACYRIREQDVSHNTFSDEVIVINLTSGSYFSLHHSAAHIWKLLELGPASVETLAATFSAAGPQAMQEIQTFLDRLHAEGLAICEQAEPVAMSPAERPAYVTPELETFNELRELLLADIIHDTGEQGWPHVAETAAPDADAPPAAERAA